MKNTRPYIFFILIFLHVRVPSLLASKAFMMYVFCLLDLAAGPVQKLCR